MSITTLNYLGFVLIVLLLYYILPRKCQWIVLLVGSVAYYLTADDPKYIIFLSASIVSTWFFGLLMQRMNDKQKEAVKADGVDREAKKIIKEKFKKKKRWVLAGCLIVLLGLLFVCKYTNFTLDNIKKLSKVFGFSFKKPKLNIILPLGISFYTFQSIGYIMDVYKEKAVAEKNPAKYALFISFFPQVIQGPIARYNDLAPQLMAERKFEFRNIKFGFELLLYGMFKKLVLADRIGLMVSTVYGDWASYGRYEIILATVLYSVQIYADFSGCMDIITGVAKMFGINLTSNFNHPYFSKTMPEFWRRWHATLGNWFKDYLFYPISVSGWCQAINRRCRKWFGAEAGRIISGIIPIYAVWFATGFWHGASWKFITWGLFHGTLIALSLIFTPVFDKLSEKLKINRECFSFRLFQMTRTFILCCIGRVFFYANGVKDALKIFKHMWDYRDPWVLLNGDVFVQAGVDTYDYIIIFVSILILWAVSMMQERFKVREKLEEQNLLFQWIIVFAAIFAILIFGIYGKGFNATDFLYRDF